MIRAVSWLPTFKTHSSAPLIAVVQIGQVAYRRALSCHLVVNQRGEVATICSHATISFEKKTVFLNYISNYNAKKRIDADCRRPPGHQAEVTEWGMTTLTT